MVLSEIAERLGARIDSEMCGAKVGKGLLAGEAVRLALPQTMMNSSGDAVACLVRKWEVGPGELLVVCDDVALPLGSMRVRAKGSDGGHNGLASIIERLGTEEFARLRVGIRDERAKGDLTPFVLGAFSATERKILKEAVETAVGACELWAARGTSAAMNAFNRKPPKEQ